MARSDAPMVTGWSVVACALLVFLLLVAFERAFAMIFVLNFSTGGPGPTLLLVFFFLSGFLYPLGLHRHWPHAPLPLDLAIVTASTLVLFSLLPLPMLAALTSLAAWLVATPLLFAFVTVLRRRFAEAAALGILIHQAGRAWLDTAPFAATGVGWTWVTLAAIALFAVWMLLARPAFQHLAGVPRVRLVTPFLFLQYGFLAVPVVAASWTQAPLLPLWVTGASGLLIGLAALRLRGACGFPAAIVSALVLALALVDLVLVQASPLVSYLFAQAASVHLLGLDTAREGPAHVRLAGYSAVILQGLALAALFLHAVGPSWAFMGEPIGALTHGRAPIYLFAMGVLLAAAVVLAPPVRSAVDKDAFAPPSGDRSYVAAVALAVIVAFGGLYVHEEPAGTPPIETPPFRVATYNIHQYFSADKTGHYNLEAVAQVIEESGAHIIGLQETEGARITSGNVDGVRWLAHRLGMHHSYGPPNTEQIYGLAVLSEFPITEYEWITLPNEQSVERAAMRVQIESPVGPIQVINTHLQTEEFRADRSAQVAALIEWIAPFDRPILLGDFNTPADDAVYDELAAGLTDAWVATGNDRMSGPTELGAGPQRIDHIWFREGWTATACDRHGGTLASDHRLVGCAFTPDGWPPPGMEA